MSDLGAALKLLEELNRRKQTHKLEYYKPYEYQLKFHNAVGYLTKEPATQKFLQAANQIGKCISERTLIQLSNGTELTAGELYERNKPFEIMAWDGEKVVNATATFPVKKPAEECFRVTLSNGKWFECAANHQVLTKNGWKFFASYFKDPTSFDFLSPFGDNVKVVECCSIGEHDLYDFYVPGYWNYIANGVIHHNTTCAAFEVAMHATGIYPDWYKGIRFISPVQILCAGNTNDATRDIIQRELFGDPENDKAIGTGTIPKFCIGKFTRKAGVPNAFDSVMVKHKSGGFSKIQLKAYEQGFKKFMGLRFEVAWADEEPPADIWEQLKRGTFSRKQSVLLITYTPEEGMTQVVKQVNDDLRQGQSLVTATWDDAPHMTEKRRKLLLEQMPEHQRDMRTKGIPFMGSGLVFATKEEDIKVEAFKIPQHWPQIWGIDFGIDHPFAAVRVAWDRDSDIIYVIDCYKATGETPPQHASSIKSRGDWIPVVWPHDGLNREKGSGSPLADLYRKEGLNMLRDKFSNPPVLGQAEGEGGNSVEFGIMEIINRMKTGRFKIFAHLNDIFTELRMYHRKNGKIVAIDDDLMSAMRYASLSVRHAKTFEIDEELDNSWHPMNSVAGY